MGSRITPMPMVEAAVLPHAAARQAMLVRQQARGAAK
jgi:hypothetical protein